MSHAWYSSLFVVVFLLFFFLLLLLFCFLFVFCKRPFYTWPLALFIKHSMCHWHSAPVSTTGCCKCPLFIKRHFLTIWSYMLGRLTILVYSTVYIRDKQEKIQNCFNIPVIYSPQLARHWCRSVISLIDERAWFVESESQSGNELNGICLFIRLCIFYSFISIIIIIWLCKKILRLSLTTMTVCVFINNSLVDPGW